MKYTTPEYEDQPAKEWPWTRFWFTAADPVGLHALRIFTGVLLLYWLLPLAGNADALFSLAGWFDREALQRMADLEGAPPQGWSFLYMAEDVGVFNTLYWLSITVLTLFTLGIAVRVTAVLTWAVVVSFLHSPVATFDADFLLAIPVFYLMIGYLFYGQLRPSASVIDRVLGPWDAWVGRVFSAARKEETPSHAANLAVRLFQVHFALVVVVSAVHKLQIADWWAGVAFFYPLHSPYATRVEDIRALAPSAQSYLFFLSLGAYLVLAWQLSFPAFAWRRGLFRWVLIGGALIGWAGSALLFKQPLFGPFYLVACLNYLSPQEWRAFGLWLRGFIPGLAVPAPEPALPRPKVAKQMARV